MENNNQALWDSTMAMGFVHKNQANMCVTATQLESFQMVVLIKFHLGQYFKFNKSLLKFGQNGIQLFFLENFGINN